MTGEGKGMPFVWTEEIERRRRRNMKGARQRVVLALPRMIELFDRGWSYARIATELGMNARTVKRHLVAEGRVRSRIENIELGHIGLRLRARVVELYVDKGWSRRRIAAEIGISVAAQRRIIGERRLRTPSEAARLVARERLSAEQTVEVARRYHGGGEGSAELAEEYGVSISTILRAARTGGKLRCGHSRTLTAETPAGWARLERCRELIGRHVIDGTSYRDLAGDYGYSEATLRNDAVKRPWGILIMRCVYNQHGGRPRLAALLELVMECHHRQRVGFDVLAKIVEIDQRELEQAWAQYKPRRNAKVRNEQSAMERRGVRAVEKPKPAGLRPVGRRGRAELDGRPIEEITVEEGTPGGRIRFADGSVEHVSYERIAKLFGYERAIEGADEVQQPEEGDRRARLRLDGRGKPLPRAAG